MDLRAPISYVNRFAQLTTETDENDARNDLCQLSEKLSFSDIHQTTIKIWSVLQFGICSYQAQPQRVNLNNASNEML